MNTQTKEQFSFTKAERKKAKLKLNLNGASGSGKTYSALVLASSLGKKIAVIDTDQYILPSNVPLATSIACFTAQTWARLTPTENKPIEALSTACS
jgi:shikimate kinase